jgi:hypothetical protein
VCVCVNMSVVNWNNSITTFARDGV